VQLAERVDGSLSPAWAAFVIAPSSIVTRAKGRSGEKRLKEEEQEPDEGTHQEGDDLAGELRLNRPARLGLLQMD
jgi:hypothetical protein